MEVFARDELPWVLARFAMAWDHLEHLADDVTQARFALFVAIADYRYVVTGYQWGSDRIELIEFEVITWDHPPV